MKSICEAAVAYGRKYQGTANIEDFEAGANYVLEEIDYILMDKDLDCEETCDKLIALIEQLKK